MGILQLAHPLQRHSVPVHSCLNRHGYGDLDSSLLYDGGGLGLGLMEVMEGQEGEPLGIITIEDVIEEVRSVCLLASSVVVCAGARVCLQQVAYDGRQRALVWSGFVLLSPAPRSRPLCFFLPFPCYLQLLQEEIIDETDLFVDNLQVSGRAGWAGGCSRVSTACMRVQVAGSKGRLGSQSITSRPHDLCTSPCHTYQLPTHTATLSLCTTDLTCERSRGGWRAAAPAQKAAERGAVHASRRQAGRCTGVWGVTLAAWVATAG